MKKSVEKLTGLSQHLRESWHTPNWKEVEILPKENNNVKQKFKESVAISEEQSFKQKGGEKIYKWYLDCNNYSKQS